MKQVLQSLKTGETEVADVPCPAVGRGQLLIRTTRSLISPGTERMIVDFGKAGWIEKARQQPDKVQQVIEKARTDGALATLEAVRNKLDQAVPLGYCSVGRVIAVGAGVAGFAAGDRVVSNGKHAEVVAVPVNLCARIPDDVGDDDAAFTVLGAIALQGIRLAAPTLGETVAVIGLGLIGLITVQLLVRANGCRVIGMDLDPAKVEMARTLGAEGVDLAAGVDAVEAAERFSRGRGVDAVLITASTQSSEPVRNAARMSRKRGRIVLVGVTGLTLSRADFYEKELTFQVSCSYGPGRYDPLYEDKGQDYPVGFVRWTEQRNFEAILDMIDARHLEVASLVSHRFPIEAADKAYELLAGGSGAALGVLLEYREPEQVPDARLRQSTVAIGGAQPTAAGPGGLGKPRVAFIGSGGFASGVLIPAFRKSGASLVTVASSAGVSGFLAARKNGAAETTTDTAATLARSDIDAVVIATRHDSHARLTMEALRAGKHVFVEKPLALSLGDIDAIEQLCRGAGEHARFLHIGFNRRFAPHVVRVKELLAGVPGPKAFVMTVNAGVLPAGHWTNDAEAGGGRIVGEACHFVDLLRFLAGARIVSHNAVVMATEAGDTASLQLGFADGSIGTVHYLANGSKAFPKERLEVFAAGRVLQLDNFVRLVGYGWPGFKRASSWRQDKGHNACAAAFVDAIAKGGPPPIPLDEILEVSRVTVQLAGRSPNGSSAISSRPADVQIA